MVVGAKCEEQDRQVKSQEGSLLLFPSDCSPLFSPVSRRSISALSSISFLIVLFFMFTIYPGNDFASDNGWPFFQVSAKEDINIDIIMEGPLERALEHRASGKHHHLQEVI